MSSSVGAGPWAAAALVVALGALGFAVAGHLRSNDLEERLALAEQRSVATAERDAGEAGAPRSTSSSVVVSSPESRVGAPPDPAGARLGIERAFELAYDGARGTEDREAAIDDPTGVETGLRLLFSGTYGSSAGNSRAVVSGVQFLSPTRAAVSYAVEVGGAKLSERNGDARVVGGEWKVTRSTICADLAALSAPCGSS